MLYRRGNAPPNGEDVVDDSVQKRNTARIAEPRESNVDGDMAREYSKGAIRALNFRNEGEIVRSNWIVGRFDKLWEKLVGAQRGALFGGYSTTVRRLHEMMQVMLGVVIHQLFGYSL